jgi:hypothetical protein
MATIQHRIKQLEEEITKLRAKQKTLRTTMNAIHDPFLHKLPPEISSRILHLSLPTLEYHPKATHTRPGSAVWAAPLKLGSVCRKWRQLAWATPDLWTTLSIAIDIGSSMMPFVVESLPGLLREWLGRSGMLPLTIYFFHHDWNSSSENDLPNDIRTHRTEAFEVITGLAIAILRLHSGRWQNLHLTASSDVFKRFSGFTKPKQLVRLELTATTVRNLLLPMPEFMLESELNLTHLKLINFPFTSINVRWDNITHATLFELPTDEGLDFLRRASSLEYYCVSMSERRDIGFTNPIFHPRLHSLNLSTPYLGEVLQKVSLPSLEEWTQNMGVQGLPMAAMLSFLKRSGCRIRVLNLDNIRPPYEGLNTLLQTIPSLERIRLSYFSLYYGPGAVMDGILTRIFYSMPGESIPESFLPHLRFIECKMDPPCAGAPFSWGFIPKLYRDGHRRSLTLRAFIHKSDITDQTAVQLLQLADEGVDLQIIDKVTGDDFLEIFRKMSAQGV